MSDPNDFDWHLARNTDPWTSHAAGWSIDPGKGDRRVARCLATAPGGLTQAEIAELYRLWGWVNYDGQIHKRIDTLRKRSPSGWVTESGLYRVSARTSRLQIVWILTGAGWRGVGCPPGPGVQTDLD